ncbi:MAG TPA: hypothetical protein VLB09_01680, partial [Nitrospiria bacterium]|nr:hypothetical protein [Nitrospiria bacterium]
HLQKAYPLLKSMYEWVVVDLPVAIDEPMLATLQNVDEVLLVSLLNIPAIRNTKRYLEIFERLGLPPNRIKLIVNRYSRRSEDSLSIKEAEKALGHPVFATIPNSYATVISSINQGIPVAELSAGSPITKAFDDISDLLNTPSESLNGNGNGHMHNGNGKKSLGNLFSRIFKPAAEVK